MNNNKNEINIDFLEVISVAWKGKKKIAIVIIISVICAFLIHYNRENPTFNASTKLYPLFKSDITSFDLSNTSNIFTVDEVVLFNQYIENLRTGEVLKDAIKKFKFVDKKNYKDDVVYEEDVAKFFFEIEITNAYDKIGKKFVKNGWKIQAKNVDQKKWLDLLNYVKIENNKISISKIKKIFYGKLENEKRLNNFKIDLSQYELRNIEKKLDKENNERFLLQKFRLEDLETLIKNSYSDYDREIEVVKKYLKEQAIIARETGIKTPVANILKVTNILDLANESDVKNLRDNIVAAPFFMRGYIAIEKQLQILDERSKEDKKIFIDNLGLLDEKRKINQDLVFEREPLLAKYKRPILISKEKIKNLIYIKEVILPRAKTLFEDTVLFSPTVFEGVNFTPLSTEFSRGMVLSLKELVALSIIFGFIIGTIYVLIQNGKNSKENA